MGAAPSSKMILNRWVMVDDNDPSITYTGDWSTNTGPLELSGGRGLPYMNTLHGVESQGSFSYSFSGSELGLTGSFQVSTSSSAANTTWECFLDGTSMNATDPSYVNTGSSFCYASGLADAPHTLLVNAKGSSSEIFWFDYLQYIPSASASLADAAITIFPTDPIFDLGTAWTPYNMTAGYGTKRMGANLNFEFYGVSFQWYGFYVAGDFFAISTASYSIDGAAPVNFTLNGTVAQPTGNKWNQLFFTTETLPPANHQVEVTYNGPANSTPLTLQYIIVQNGTASSGSSSGAGGGNPTPTGSLSGGGAANTSATGVNANTSKANAGSIAGGVVAGIVILILGTFSFFWVSRRRRYMNTAGHYDASTEHSRSPQVSPVPFQILPSLSLSVAKRAEPQQFATLITAPRFSNVDSGIRLLEHSDNAASIDSLPPRYSEISE